MEAFRLRKKFPEVSQDEMFDLINRFKYVRPCTPHNDSDADLGPPRPVR